MTVYKQPRGRTWSYDFWWSGDRYTGSTKQTTRTEAEAAEAEIKRKLRLRAAGLLPDAPATSPRFQDWSKIYFDHVCTRRQDDIKRPDRIEDLLRCVLRFFGARPSPQARGKWAPVEGEPYRDLRLSDPIDDPMLLLTFEDWMRKKGLSGQTKNQYRSTLSQLYVLALHPAYRKRTGVALNPVVGLPRDSSVERTSTFTVDELRAWLSHASYHIRLAVAIAAMAPKLRLTNVLALDWQKHFDVGLTHITIGAHKTDRATGRPLVSPIDEQLRRILLDAQQRHGKKGRLITYRGAPLKSIRGGVMAAAKAAGLTWGRFVDKGVTFHTIRHTMATMLAELSDLDGGAPLSESTRKTVMDHRRLETTQRYTHIRPAGERRALERLSKQLPIADIVTQPWNRVTRATAGRRSRVGDLA
jgi:integrase